MPAAVFAVVVDGDVLQDREAGNQPLFLAAFGQEPDPPCQRLCRFAKPYVFAFDLKRAFCGRIGPQQCQRGFRAPRPDQPGKAENFTFAQHKIRHRTTAAQLHLLAVQQDRRILRDTGFFRKAVFNPAAHHHLDQTIIVGFRDEAIAHRFPIAQHGDAVADFKDLFEVMRDENDRNTLPAQLAHHLEQMRHFGGGQSCGGFIQHEDTGVERERLGDFDKLLFGHRQFPDRHIERHVDLKPGHNVLGAFAHGFAVQQAKPRAQFAGEEHIFNRIQIGDEAEFLKNDADPCGDGLVVIGELALLTLNEDGPCTGLQNTRENLHQGGFPGPVFPKQRVNFASVDLKIDTVQHLNGAKSLFDSAQLQHDAPVVGHCGTNHPRHCAGGGWWFYQLKSAAFFASTTRTSIGTSLGTTRAPHFCASAMARPTRT